ncbi:MAG: ArsC/Spx/MgsR family protein [Nakamurella sp.]
MPEITIFHNAACSTSRYAKDCAVAGGVSATIVEYLKHPLTYDEILVLLGKLEDPPADLVRKDAFFAEQGLDAADYQAPAEVAALLAQFPRLMQRPVLVRGGRAIIGRPKSRADTFLTAD